MTVLLDDLHILYHLEISKNKIKRPGGSLGCHESFKTIKSSKKRNLNN